MEYTNIKLEKENRVATIRLNRPDALNALNPELITELAAAVAEAGNDESIKALVVRGEGRAFCAGADLKERAASDSAGGDNFFAGTPGEGFYTFTLMKPLIAAVHGFALGAGCEMSLLCDLRIASDDARFGLPEVGLGYIPSAGGTQTLPRTIAPGVALGMKPPRYLKPGDVIDLGIEGLGTQRQTVLPEN